MQATELPELCTVKEARKYLRVARSTLMEWIYSGQLPAKKYGGRWRITREAVLAGPQPIAREA